MNVKMLISELQKLPDNCKVIVDSLGELQDIALSVHHKNTVCLYCEMEIATSQGIMPQIRHTNVTNR